MVEGGRGGGKGEMVECVSGARREREVHVGGVTGVVPV